MKGPNEVRGHNGCFAISAKKMSRLSFPDSNQVVQAASYLFRENASSYLQPYDGRRFT